MWCRLFGGLRHFRHGTGASAHRATPVRSSRSAGKPSQTPVRDAGHAVHHRLDSCLALHIFLSVVEQGLRARSSAAGSSFRIGAVVFIHRFGALPNAHFHCHVIDAVFEADGMGGVRFHEARGVGAEAVAEVEAALRLRVARACPARTDRALDRPVNPWPDSGSDSGAVFRLHQHAVPACRLLTPSCSDPEYPRYLRKWCWASYPCRRTDSAPELRRWCSARRFADLCLRGERT